jgi:hypothetical protein
MMTNAQNSMPRQTMPYELQTPEDGNQENQQQLQVLRAMLEEERSKNERATRCIVDLLSALCQALQENEDQEQDMKELLQTCEQIHEEKMDLLKCTNISNPGPNNVSEAPVIGHMHSKAQRKRSIVSMNSLVEELLEEQKEEEEQAMTAMKKKMNQEQELKNQAYQKVIKDLISKNVLLIFQQEKQVAQGSSTTKKISTRTRGKTRSLLLEPKCVAHDDGSAVSSNCSRGQKMTSYPTIIMYADRKGEERLNGGPSKINQDRNSQHKKGIVQTTGVDSDSMPVDQPSDKTKRDQVGPLLCRNKRRLLQRRMSDYLAQDSETGAAHISQDDMSLMTYNRLSSGGVALHTRAMSDDENDECIDVDMRGVSSNASTTISSSALKSSKEAVPRSTQAPRVSNDGTITKVTTRTEHAFAPTADAGGGPQQFRRRERLHKRRSMIELFDEQQEIVEEKE